MATYAELTDVKEYLQIPSDVDVLNGKLNILLDAVNDEISNDTGEAAPNNQLKLGALLWIEKQNTQIAGAKSQGDGDYKVTFNPEEVPAEAARFIRPYVLDEYRNKYNTKNHKTAEFTAG